MAGGVYGPSRKGLDDALQDSTKSIDAKLVVLQGSTIRQQRR
jgi:hypothetical protein